MSSTTIFNNDTKNIFHNDVNAYFNNAYNEDFNDNDDSEKSMARNWKSRARGNKNKNASLTKSWPRRIFCDLSDPYGRPQHI